jgi:hypothetical protein
MRLTCGKLLLQRDWKDWQDSEFLQLDQYFTQGMFSNPCATLLMRLSLPWSGLTTLKSSMGERRHGAPVAVLPALAWFASLTKLMLTAWSKLFLPILSHCSCKKPLDLWG